MFALIGSSFGFILMILGFIFTVFKAMVKNGSGYLQKELEKNYIGQYGLKK